FECNRIPVSGSSQDYPHQSGETLSGGFYADSRISQSLKITVSGDQTATENDIMTYDLNRDGRVGLQDAVRALRQGNPEAAIKALQCVTGK
ncbi:MAG: hypothetical protein GY795_22280, partial [Desulfobacterales bacterium]|nr:hypothetical protein [Desulfobacterales bacterium]